MATTHVISEGDTIQRIAKQHRIADWRTLYEHPKNAVVRARSDGPNVLPPGEALHVPDPEPAWVPCNTGAVHEFVQHRERTRLRLLVLGPDERPLSGRTYRLDVGGQAHEGVVPDDGMIAHEVDPAATDAMLVVKDPGATQGPREHRFALQLGWLAPVATGKGLQARLHNLGLYHGEIDGHEDSAATRRALATFHGGPAPAPGQDAVIEPTSPQTREVLKSAHGC